MKDPSSKINRRKQQTIEKHTFHGTLTSIQTQWHIYMNTYNNNNDDDDDDDDDDIKEKIIMGSIFKGLLL